MPILKQEIDLHPADIFARAEPHWTVAYVRSRQEKALARYLLHRDLPFYLPQYRRSRRSGGRLRVSHLPLFPGYVFLPVSAAERRQALKSNLIVKLIEAVDQTRLHRELEELRRLQLTGAPLVPHPFLDVGDPVKIVEGPLKGCRGRILRRRGGLRLVVSVTFLRRSVAVSLDRDAVAPG